ncbi:CYFA0S01e09098g1_1 [Cyberlindnera fabianii]|uniref:CYFA0S01e09098g1_1 n=1 Tax=Cyberlindnera fabianii TaxID=36022 RepID=A0A061AJF2_CYBFA|nr:Small ubiquitin-related modifier 1 [Cyberlindnera fabianii]CDR37269.1 CYFA0S01e09098g1_1 [Cyberlindnera fabianii]
MPPRATSPPTEDDNSDKIKVCFHGQTQRLFFSLKKTIKLKKAMTTFCKSSGGNVLDFEFLFEGEVISQNSTPLSLGMSDGDTIDVKSKNDGGC